MSIFLREFYGPGRLSAMQIIRDPMLFLAFGFGSGLSRYMPGTLGTLAAVPLYLALLAGNNWIYLLVTLLSMVLGVFICDHAAQKLQAPDFGGIVWDEIAGFLVTMCWLPFSWQSLLAGFVAFRFFDILKPWPIGWLDKHVHGGLGIMLDDVAAGVFAALILRLWF
ncbi:MAG: phosphatidylglycerophosphatase A [Methylococcales bacterium]|nr:phosphatidylglycerophosphatase A [Methylococcales bacterium]